MLPCRKVRQGEAREGYSLCARENVTETRLGLSSVIEWDKERVAMMTRNEDSKNEIDQQSGD